MGGPRRRFETGRTILRELWQEANRDQLSLLGAALAYYALFSLGPLLFLIVNIAGLALGERLAESRVLAFVEAIVVGHPMGAPTFRAWPVTPGPRRRMLVAVLDAGSAALRGGYASASQFSREFPRQFGQPPKHDIKLLRSSAGPLESSPEDARSA